MNAVHNENAKNLLNDMWRLFQFTKSTSNPEHPFSKFGTGNLETLKTTPTQEGVDTRQGLLDFHGRYYSANVSKLVVLGRESLDELQALVEAKFEGYVNQDVSVPVFGTDALGPGLGKVYRVVPVKELRSMTILWALPCAQHAYRTKPERVLSHLIGHEGEGSILQLLKSKGCSSAHNLTITSPLDYPSRPDHTSANDPFRWANGLSAGLTYSTTCFAGFTCSVDLTEEGLQHTDAIVAVVYQYLRVLGEVSTSFNAFSAFAVIDLPARISCSYRTRSRQHVEPCRL